MLNRPWEQGHLAIISLVVPQGVGLLKPLVQGDLNSRTVFDHHEIGSQAKDVLLEAPWMPWLKL